MGYIFHFKKNFRIQICLLPWGVSFFDPKNRITQRIIDQNRKYFNPLLIGPDRHEEKMEVENCRSVPVK